jgi:hypothetical protein
LRYNDPNGNWPPWDQITHAATTVSDKAKEGLQVAATKVTEFKQAIKNKAGEVKLSALCSVGIVREEQYTDTRDIKNPVPVYHVGDKGIVPTLLGDLGGISIYPIGAFVKESYYTSHPEISAHESYHYNEQSYWGMVPWLLAYYGEMGVDWAYYGGDYWKGPYNVNEKEMAAREYANTPKNPDPIPAPWWQEPWNNFTQAVGNYWEAIGNYYSDSSYFRYYSY